MPVIRTTDDTLEKLLKSHNKIIINFYTDNCGLCRQIKPIYDNLSDDTRFGEITFASINAATNPTARTIAHVTNFPFFSIFSSGKLIDGKATSRPENITDLLKKLQTL